MEKKHCIICQKEFIPKTGNAKYCSLECSKIGHNRTRRKWEKDTGYLEKQREKMRNYRDNVTAEERAELDAQARKDAINAKRRETRRKNKAKDKLIYEAEHGCLTSKMILALQEHGNYSRQYWEAFQEYNKDRRVYVNRISVSDNDFVDKVLASIQEIGVIQIHS